MDGLVSINGSISDIGNAQISVADRGFLMGDSIFEVMAAFSTTVLDIERHLDRLRRSADLIELELPWKNKILKSEITELVKLKKYNKAYVRISITRGIGFGLSETTELRPNKLIYTVPSPSFSNLPEGLNIMTKLSNNESKSERVKSNSYLHSIISIKQGSRLGFHDILWKNSEGLLKEASTSNIFFISRHGDEIEVTTPSLDSGILAGITRQRIIDLLVNAGIRVTERPVFHEELASFDESFLSSSVKGLSAINKIDTHKLYTSRPHSFFGKIRTMYNQWVSNQLGHAVEWSNGNKIS